MALGLLQSSPPLGPPGFAPQVPYIDGQSTYKYTCEAMGGRYAGYCRSPGGSMPNQGPTPCMRYCHMPGGDSVNQGSGWYPPLNTLEGLGESETKKSLVTPILLVAATGTLLYILMKK